MAGSWVSQDGKTQELPEGKQYMDKILNDVRCAPFLNDFRWYDMDMYRYKIYRFWAKRPL